MAKFRDKTVTIRFGYDFEHSLFADTLGVDEGSETITKTSADGMVSSSTVGGPRSAAVQSRRPIPEGLPALNGLTFDTVTVSWDREELEITNASITVMDLSPDGFLVHVEQRS